MSPLYMETISAYDSAVSHGTAQNRLRQAKTYITFAVYYSINFLFPSITQASMYTKYLANSFISPATVNNYLSGARHWIQHHKGDNSSFNSPQVQAVSKSCAKISKHVPNQAPPLTPAHMKIICRFLDSYIPLSSGMKPALLIGYYCFLRASNILSPSEDSWGGVHTLLASDIALTSVGLTVKIRSTKTFSSPAPVLISIPFSPSPALCPVRAWARYHHIVNPWPFGPAFLNVQGLPLTPRPLVQLIRLALKSAHVPAFDKFSMHSIRRGAAQAAAKGGVSEQELKNHGIWKSDKGLHAYVPKSSGIVPQVINSALAP